jgi:hypothetical protein
MSTPNSPVSNNDMKTGASPIEQRMSALEQSVSDRLDQLTQVVLSLKEPGAGSERDRSAETPIPGGKQYYADTVSHNLLTSPFVTVCDSLCVIRHPLSGLRTQRVDDVRFGD